MTDPNTLTFARPKWASGAMLAGVGLLALAATVLLILTRDRSVLTGLLILAWGAGACRLAYHAGVTGSLDGTKVVLAYTGFSVLLYVLLNGLYRLLGC